VKVRVSLTIIAGALALALISVSGCEESAKNTARARPPATAPQPAQASLSTSGTLAELPLPQGLEELTSFESPPLPAVDLLIAKVEAAYDAGQKAYQAGQLADARRDFNSAVNMLMKSGLEATGDTRLKQLFDQISDTMQNYELEAEQKDEAFADSADNSDEAVDETDQNQDQSQAQAVPESTAPIEEIANMESLPATDPRLAAMAEKELMSVPHDLPLTVNASVLQYLSFFETPHGRDIVETGLQRAGRYRAMIESTLKKEGLPLDLIYLAQAESAFKPRAVSSKKARGIWQFMPYTGEEYGLNRNYYVDERDDPVAATRAAAEHLRDLYGMFGDWYLVMAAYNSGPVNVARAVERTGYADFWQLQKRNTLPAQTKNYVPIILALTLIAKDPALYGIQVDPDPPLKYDAVQLGHSISLQLVADATGASLDDLQNLNPELIRGITPASPDFTLRVPPGTAAGLQSAINAIPPDKWTSWRLAKLAPGESLGEMAKRFHVTLASLENVNALDAHDLPDPGAQLIIPAAPPRTRLVHYRVRRGDTLYSIALHYSVSVSNLKRWNRLRYDRAPLGRWLRIYEVHYPYEQVRRASADARFAKPTRRTASAETASQAGGLEHRVRPGETLWSIAHAYRTTVSALKAANPFLANRELEVGDLLIVSPRQ
jgi:membrane-bound lytic murein transglycosylase D